MRKQKAIIKRTALLLVLLVAYIAALSAFDMHCPIADIFGIKCPTCGVSRAMLSLLKLDFEASFNYHPLAIPLIISVWLLFNIEYFKHKRLLGASALLTVTLNFALYLFNFIKAIA